ncbi:MAG: hypothetical protein ACOYLB_11910 [Phototrophicaceae bacterium]
MSALPRIITVDPTGVTARNIHAIVELSQYACRQVDVPNGTEALSEIQLGGASLAVMYLHLEDWRAFDLVDKIRESAPNLPVIIIADEDDPVLELEDQLEQDIIYLPRPLDVLKFSKAIFAIFKGQHPRQAMLTQQITLSNVLPSYGEVPPMNLDRAKTIVDKLQTDLGAMSILLVGRDGRVLLERGTPNYIPRDLLVKSLMPSSHVLIDMREIIGGNTSSLQYFDGDNRNVYVLSVGLHHSLVISYHHERGGREFGAVNRFGRRAVEDLIALLGANAFLISKVTAESTHETNIPDDVPRLSRKRVTRLIQAIQPVEEPEIEVARAAEFGQVTIPSRDERIQLNALADELFDVSFLDQIDQMVASNADDLFSLDNIQSIANANSSRLNGARLSFDDAQTIGVINSGDE